MSFETRHVPHQGPIRVLSLDGGGIYGYTAALWLRELCERDPEFLKPGNVWLFAGCSSGALNTLLLARSDNPRKVVMDGELERFWKNSKPIFTVQPRSMFGGALFSEKSFLEYLEQTLGRETVLGDLPQNVLISTFDWHGRRTYPDFEVDGRIDPSTPHWQRAQDNQDHGFSDDALGDEASYRKRVGVTRHWQPRFFSNVLRAEDDTYRAAEVAYGAATPPSFRAIRGGIGDGASFSANPSARAVSTIVRVVRLHNRDACENARGPLWRTRVLSLGAGTDLPYLDRKDLDVNWDIWNVRPSNLAKQQVYSPTAYALQPAGEETVQVCFDLLGNRFQRLNPDIIDLPGWLDMPTVTAAAAAGFGMHDFLLRKIETGVAGPRSQDALDQTADRFLNKTAWKGQST